MRVVLGIESSCDETAVALVREDRTILASTIATQLEEHAAYGGVVPEIAARAHLNQIDRLYEKAMREAGLTLADVSAVAATTGPGLIGGVMVGTMFGKALAAATGKPFIAVNHLEGHALTLRLTHDVQFPYLLLLVSGGHCQILRVEGVGQYVKLGGTKDDALGEAFDKCAKMMGLPYPGGPALERAALKGTAKYDLPRPLIGTEGCDFSFSGLKTAVRLLIEKEAPLNEQLIADIAASFQRTVIEVVRDRLTNALAQSDGLTALAVAGGVAANKALAAGLQDIAAKANLPLLVAPMALCTDNAAMIAWAGMERLLLGKTDALDVQPRARWPLTELT